MRTRPIILLPILCLLPQLAHAQPFTVISLSDPSLQGTTLASNQVNFLPENPPPSSPPIALLDQQVVLNAAGTLDFYYRMEALPDQPLSLDTGVTIAPFGYNDTPITSIDFPISLAAASDGPGAIAPNDGLPLTAGAPNALQYALFLFGGDPPPNDPLPVQWTLTPTGTNFLIVRTNLTNFAPIGSAQIDTIDADSDRTFYDAEGIFVPIPAPEPASLALLLAALPTLSRRRRPAPHV